MHYESISAHQIMLEDSVRTRSYERAIQVVVKPGHRVLDFGCGTGILSFFASRAGAKIVHAVDRSGFTKVAKAIARKNGFHNIIFHHCEGDKLALDEPVDVIVSEWMGTFLFSEWMLPSLIRLRDRYLADGGVMVPEKIFLRAGLVCDDTLHNKLSFFRQKPYGIDFSLIEDWPFYQPFPIQFSGSQILPARADLGDVNLHTCKGEPDLLEGTVVADRNAPIYGLCGWFDVQLTGEMGFETGPEAPATHWKQLFFPLRKPFEVKEGNEIRIRIHFRREQRGEGTVWRWSISDGARTEEMDSFVHKAWLKLPDEIK
jgi:SAM-dependent methyltransferase